MNILQRGQRTPLATFTPATRFTLKIELPLPTPPDISIFGLDESRRLADDRYFVFYNQPSSPERAIVMDEQTQVFTVDLALVPLSVHRLLLTATSDDQVFSAMHQGHVTLSAGGKEVLRFEVTGRDFQAERAVMLLELYRYQGAWRIAGDGQGFAGGLRVLLESLGGEVVEPSPPPKSTLILSKLDLRKQQVKLELKKHGLDNEQARVMVVMDASGSMWQLYHDGIVQETIERLVPVALQLDDNGEMEFWYYGDRSKRMPNVTRSNCETYVKKYPPKGTGYGNNEPPVMKNVLTEHRQAGSKLPSLVLFITDGGIYTNSKIEKIIRDSTEDHLFWQFIGLGNENYGLLAEFDELKDRKIDNTGFFAIDDISEISDEELYRRLLSEYPSWRKEALRQGILK